MAQQLGVGFSKTIKAFGTFATGPFSCYDSSVAGMKSCFNTSIIDYDRINKTFYNMSLDTKIDNITNLQTSKIVVYVGTADKVVPSTIGTITAKIYDWFSNDTDNVKLIRLAGANHSMPTSSFGSSCSKSVSPFMAACHYDLAFVTLDFFYGGNAMYPTPFDKT